MPGLLIIFVIAFLFPQNEGYFQILTIVEKASIVDVDDVGNIYTTSASGLTLFNAAGKQELFYETRAIGKISGIDIKNPDRVLVFFKETSKILILNDVFKLHSWINLTPEAGLFDVTLACLSTDENIWLYSNYENRLIKISEKGDFAATSAIIEDITGTRYEPNFMREYQQKLYLNIPRTGILEFDIQGNFIRVIPLKGLTTFCVADGKVCYFSGKKMKVYTIETGLEQITQLPETTYTYTMPDLHGSELLMYYADPNSVGVLSIPQNQK